MFIMIQKNHQNYHDYQIEKKFQSSHNVITNVYFNDYNQFKYDLTFYICEHMHDVMTFDNSIELRFHVLNYHEMNARSTKSIYRIRKINYI